MMSIATSLYSTKSHAVVTDTVVADWADALLDNLLESTQGWFYQAYVEGNPSRVHDKDFHGRWYASSERQQARADRIEWAAQGYNTYIAPCLFSEKGRSYTTALPSDRLWIDDAAIEGAELVESSEGNYQSWLQLDRPITASERSHFQRAIRDRAAGADACSANAVSLARLPGGWNTKRADPWLVRVARPATIIFSVDALSAEYGPPDVTSSQKRHNSADWDDLPDGVRLTTSGRFRRLCEHNEQLRLVCAGERIALRTKNNRIDDSLSTQRAIFVSQLIRARYAHNEIRALAIAFTDVLDSGRGDQFFADDIDRLIFKLTPAGYKPEATRSLQANQKAPAHGGRHYEITAAELLDFYHTYADVGPAGLRLDWTISEVAAWHQVSISTIRRREAELVAAGQIRRELTPDRQQSYLLVAPLAVNVCSQPITELYTEDRAIIEPDPISTDVLSQFDLPCPVAANCPEIVQCEEQAHAEITQPPSESPAGELRRDLVTTVRRLARRVNEPHWEQRDYAEWTGPALQAEIARLSAQLADTASGVVPTGGCVDSEALNSPVEVSHSGAVLIDPYSPKERWSMSDEYRRLKCAQWELVPEADTAELADQIEALPTTGPILPPIRRRVTSHRSIAPPGAELGLTWPARNCQ